MQTEGIIKYNCKHTKSAIIKHSQISDINLIRTFLFEKNLIGIDEYGIGFGNISKRLIDNIFIISGSGTGASKTLSANDYAIVNFCDNNANYLECEGAIKASSESLSHFAIYQTLPNVKYVVHIHHQRLWDSVINILPTTAENAEYGTPDIANSISNLIRSELDFKQKNTKSQIIIMGGHSGGLLFFGEILADIYRQIEELVQKNS